jgi:hypothetical protein
MLTFKKVKKKPKSDLQKLENKLWDIFSVYIRLRDSGHNGVGKCFTCGELIHWTKGDCGHGIGRQHKATKFNECNNHLQCKKCNGFDGGRRETYKENMNKKYGPGTWERMEVAARGTAKWSTFILQNNIDYYTQKAKELKAAKGMV